VVAPVTGKVVSRNPLLGVDPGAVSSDPYGTGWLADIQSDEADDVKQFIAADEAEARARHDLRRFRRQVALHLLADRASIGPTQADGGVALMDLRLVLGWARYVEVVRDVLS